MEWFKKDADIFEAEKEDSRWLIEAVWTDARQQIAKVASETHCYRIKAIKA